MRTEKQQAFERIAKKLGFETIDTRGRDSLDFRDVSVWAIADALEQAYALGMTAAYNVVAAANDAKKAKKATTKNAKK